MQSISSLLLDPTAGYHARGRCAGGVAAFQRQHQATQYNLDKVDRVCLGLGFPHTGGAPLQFPSLSVPGSDQEWGSVFGYRVRPHPLEKVIPHILSNVYRYGR